MWGGEAQAGSWGGEWWAREWERTEVGPVGQAGRHTRARRQARGWGWHADRQVRQAGQPARRPARSLLSGVPVYGYLGGP